MGRTEGNGGAAAYSLKVTPAFRVGVTGQIDLGPDHQDIRDEVAAALATVRAETEKAAASHAGREVYRSPTSPLLRLLSPLAPGADRLVAQEGLAAGFQLETAFPFEQDEYEQTFHVDDPDETAASIAEFRALLSEAGKRVVVLDGDRNDDFRKQSYGAVGRLVVRNCDLLIAIWSEVREPAGAGGTSDTLAYALRAGVPVWWINVDRSKPSRLLCDPVDLAVAGAAQEPSRSNDYLEAIVAAVIHPPKHLHPHSTLWQRSMNWLRARCGVATDPLGTYLNEPAQGNRKVWNIHPATIGALKTRGRRWSAGAEKQGVLKQWGSRFLGLLKSPWLLAEAFRYDPNWPGQPTLPSLASKYQNRYRTSYMLVFTAAAVALIAAVVGLAVSWPVTISIGRNVYELHEAIALWFELAALVLILLLIVWNELHQWHERYINYRLLRELMRQSRVLAALGSALPGNRVNLAVPEFHHSWVAWFFAATERANPIATGPLGGPGRIEAQKDRIVELVEAQVNFHRHRDRDCAGAAELLDFVGRSLFIATLVTVLARVGLSLCHVEEGWTRALALLCAILPAVSAMAFGVKAYEEFNVLADESRQMIAALNDVRRRLDRVDLTLPLASQVLANEAQVAARLMLSEVTGWAQLFRMKVVDA